MVVNQMAISNYSIRKVLTHLLTHLLSYSLTYSLTHLLAYLVSYSKSCRPKSHEHELTFLKTIWITQYFKFESVSCTKIGPSGNALYPKTYLVPHERLTVDLQLRARDFVVNRIWVRAICRAKLSVRLEAIRSAAWGSCCLGLTAVLDLNLSGLRSVSRRRWMDELRQQNIRLVRRDRNDVRTPNPNPHPLPHWLSD